ncbi:MAG: hypothetical protein ACEPOZ_17750 [Marinifilaceae bacterium]
MKQRNNKNFTLEGKTFFSMPTTGIPIAETHRRRALYLVDILSADE